MTSKITNRSALNSTDTVCIVNDWILEKELSYYTKQSYVTEPGNYAGLFTHSGNINNLRHTVNYIWGTWLPKCNYEYLHGPDFEFI